MSARDEVLWRARNIATAIAHADAIIRRGEPEAGATAYGQLRQACVALVREIEAGDRMAALRAKVPA